MFKVLKLVFNCGVVFTTAVLSKIDFSSGIGSQSNISIVLELSAWSELPRNPKRPFASRSKIDMILIRKSGATSVLGPLYRASFKILAPFAKLCGTVPDTNFVDGHTTGKPHKVNDIALPRPPTHYFQNSYDNGYLFH